MDVVPLHGSLSGEPLEGEPFIVPLPIPLLAGPSTLATLLLLQGAASWTTGSLMVAVAIA